MFPNLFIILKSKIIKIPLQRQSFVCMPMNMNTKKITFMTIRTSILMTCLLFTIIHYSCLHPQSVFISYKIVILLDNYSDIHSISSNFIYLLFK